MKSDMTVGKLLANARTSRRLSQQEVSDAANVGRNYYNRVENDELTPKLGTLVDIKAGLNLKSEEWTAILSRYLVDAGAATISETSRLFDEAVKTQASDVDATALQIDRASKILADLSQSDRSIAVELLAFMRRYPAFFPAMRALMDANQTLESSADSTIPEHPTVREPRGQPSDPVMAKLVKKKAAEKAARS